MSRSSGEKARSSSRIVILSPSAPPVSTGGISTAHFALYEGLKNRGFTVELLTFADFGNARFYHDSDPAIFRFGSPRIVTKVIQLFGRLWFWLRERRFRTRIYQTGDVWKARAGAKKIATRIKKTKPDILIFPDQSSPAFWFEKLPGQRWIQISHHQALRFINQTEFGEHSLKDALEARRIEQVQLERSDFCVTPSHYMADVVRSFVTQTRPIHVIPNLVEILPATIAHEKSVYTRIFIPSGGSRFKGSDVLPALVSKFMENPEASTFEFFISGDLSPSQKNAILDIAPNARIVAPGHLSHSEVMNHLSRSHICISPTWIENQSMALLEAKSLNVPFVAFDVGGNRELCGPSDRVTPRGDIAALAGEAMKILKNAAPSMTVWQAEEHNERALDQWVQLLKNS